MKLHPLTDGVARANPMTSCDPYLDAGMRGCIVNMARKNCWRVAGYDIEDLVQEGYICYYNCHRRYVGKPPRKRADGTLRRPLPAANPDPTARRHFMSLVKRAFFNRIETLALKQPRRKEVLGSDMLRDDNTMEQAFETIMPPALDVTNALDLLRALPQESVQLLTLLVTDAVELTRHRRSGVRRETTNELLCRKLGIKDTVPLRELVQSYFMAK